MNFKGRLIIFTFISLQPVLVFYSCQESPANDNGENKFYYFPETNVYYDEAAGLYFYSLDSGKDWSSFPHGKTNKPLLSGNKIEISNGNNEPIWKQNDIHVTTYNGTRLAILSADTGMTNKQKSVLKKSAKTLGERADSINEVEEAKKPNFLQRIFGKKKKKN